MGADDGRPLLRLAEDLTTLTRSIHDAAAAQRARIEPVPDDLGALMELRTALLAGTVPIDGARAIYRYHPGTAAAWSRLDATGWLGVDDEVIAPTDRSTALSERVLHVHDDVTSTAWGEPVTLLDLAAGIVADADDIGPAFHTWRAAGWEPAGTVAGRLFLVLTTLRYLRADAHAAAWQVGGHTAASVVALDQRAAERIAIEADTDIRHSAALSATPAEQLDELIQAVAELAPLPAAASRSRRDR